jgi:hypothetical protein
MFGPCYRVEVTFNAKNGYGAYGGYIQIKN